MSWDPAMLVAPKGSPRRSQNQLGARPGQGYLTRSGGILAQLTGWIVSACRDYDKRFFLSQCHNIKVPLVGNLGQVMTLSKAYPGSPC